MLIINLFKDIIGIDVLNNEIIFDPTRECYCLHPNKENEILDEFVPESTVNKEIVKYTSFNTLVATLTSGKIRLNSLTTMNDKNEDSYFHEYTKNYFDEIEDLGESFLFVNDKFITSFSTRNDELDMWRFYGDDAKGVCMVFSNYEDSGVKSILYCDKEKTSLLKNIKHLLEELKATKINFRFPLFEHYSPFYKSKDFQNEEEHRLLIIDENPADWTIGNSFNILAPYIELPLRLKGANVGPKILTHKKIDAQSKHFPLVLNAIILGPEMPYKSIYN